MPNPDHNVRLLWLAGHVAPPSASQTILVEAKGATTSTGDGTSTFSNQNVTTGEFLMPQWSIGYAILKPKMSTSIPDNSSKRRTLQPAQCTHEAVPQTTLQKQSFTNLAA